MLHNEVSRRYAEALNFKYKFFVDLCGPGADIAMKEIQDYGHSKCIGEWACDGNYFLCENDLDAMPFKLGWMVNE